MLENKTQQQLKEGSTSWYTSTSPTVIYIYYRQTAQINYPFFTFYTSSVDVQQTSFCRVQQRTKILGEKQIHSSLMCALKKLNSAKCYDWIRTDTFSISQLKNNWEAEQVLIIPQLNWERQQEIHLWVESFRYKKFQLSEPYEICFYVESM